MAVYLNLDKVIKIIRNADEPKPKLIKAFKLTERQAEAILNMRLRSLRKLEETQMRNEHGALLKEQRGLKKLVASKKLQSEKMAAELKTVETRFGQKTELGERRTQFETLPEIEGDVSPEAFVEKEPITVLCSQKLWLRTLKTHQEPNGNVKYREGDRGRFWIHAQTTDRLMLLSTDGRFYTLDCSKLPGGRGLGEAIRGFIDLPPDADIVAAFVHREGRKIVTGFVDRARLCHRRRRRGRDYAER